MIRITGIEHGRYKVKIPDLIYRNWRAIPGVAPARLPVELLTPFVAECKTRGFVLSGLTAPSPLPVHLPADLRQHQRRACEAMIANGRMILAAVTGSGKTRCAIEAVKALGAQTMLVVAPAMALPVWERELGKWYPNKHARSMGSVVCGVATAISNCTSFLHA